MKFSSKYLRKTFSFITCICIMLSVSACGGKSYELPYDANSSVSGFNVVKNNNADMVVPFASNLCVVKEDVMQNDFADTSSSAAAILFDVSNAEVLYSKNAHEQLYPASLTKVLTALVALKYGTGDQVLVATDEVYVDESGAQLCGLKPGDTMTLNQALYIALVNSANDAALLIAENIGGSVEKFVEMMNEEARALGATNSNFVNPHGLSDPEHYTTAYDMYLIFNEAMKYEKFVEIIQTVNYETTYYSTGNEPKQLSVRNTNKYVNGEISAPANVTVIGGKTGTTNAAGNCLMLLVRDKNGSPYVSIVLRAETRDELYAQMTDLLEEIGK